MTPMTPAAPLKPRSWRERNFPTDREKALDSEIELVESILGRLRTNLEDFDIDRQEGGTVSERLADVEMMIDAQGWHEIFEHDQDRGLTLLQVKQASRQLRELLAGAPLIQNGARVRTAHTWGGGVDFSQKSATQGKPSRLPARIQDLIDSPAGQRYLFGNQANEEMERCAFSDGNFFYLGENVSKRGYRVPVAEITGYLPNPNNAEEIWAWRRTWTQNPTDDVSQQKILTRWYYTDICPPSRSRGMQVVYQGVPEQAEIGYTMFDIGFNRQVGWPLGIPDALSVISWIRLYREFMLNGYVMSRSLARFALKVTVGSKAGALAAATELTRPGQAGAAAIEGQGNSMTPLATAGRGYDFGSGKPLAAMIAAGLGVSLLALLSDPSAATGSNAAAQTLDPIAEATAVVRQRAWQDFFVRLFRWYGLQGKLVASWGKITSDTLQRIVQSIFTADQLEVLGPDVIQALVAAAFGLADPGSIPPGWKPKSQRTQTPQGSGDGTNDTPGDTGATGQGQNDGGGNSPNDHSTDQTN